MHSDGGSTCNARKPRVVIAVAGSDSTPLGALRTRNSLSWGTAMTRSMMLRTAPYVMHNSNRTDPARFSRERDIRRFSWARRSLQGSERPLLRPCRARRVPNTILGSSARQLLLLRCQAEEQAVSSPTVSGSSFIFQRPTCQYSLAAKDSIPPLDPALQRPLQSLCMALPRGLPKRNAPYSQPRILTTD